MARRPPVAALLGLAIGIAIGLIVGWGVWPVQFTNAEPADLRPSYKDDYLRMIGATYSVNGSLDEARQRLARLGITSPVQVINGLIVRERMSNSDLLTREALVRLALALSGPPPDLESESKPAPVADAVHAMTVPSFRLVERTQLNCTDEPAEAFLRFLVRDSNGKDLPNVGIQVLWPEGDETLYTGLKPERGLGYADLEVATGTYQVTLLNAASDPIPDLSIGPRPANCQADGNATPRGWRIVLQQK